MTRHLRAALAGAAAVLLVLVGLVGTPAQAAPTGPPNRPPAVTRAAPGPARVDVTVAGTLTGLTGSHRFMPAFAATTNDYAVRCTAARNDVSLTFAGSGLAIDGRRGATITKTFSVVEHQAIVVNANGTQYWIRCLPRDFPELQVTKNGDVPAGWYLIESEDPFTGEPVHNDLNYGMILDTNGTPVWYMANTGGYFNTQARDVSTLTWSPNLGAVGVSPYGAFNRYDLTSQEITRIAPPGEGHLDQHEYIQLKNGNWAWIVTPPVGGRDLSKYVPNNTPKEFWDCVVQEVDGSGNATWQWKMSEHVSLDETLNTTRTDDMAYDKWDPYHCNSVEEDPATGDLLISSRDTSSLYKVSRATGQVLWQLRGTPAATNRTTPYPQITLTDPLGFAAQHDARFTADGTISLFDNHVPRTDGTTRGLELKLDLAARTATPVWSWTNSKEAPSLFMGSFMRNRATGENVLGWGSQADSGVTEVDNAGVVRRRIKTVGLAGYRAHKVSASALQAWVLREAAGRPIIECSAPILDKEAQLAYANSSRTGQLRTDLPNGGCERDYAQGALLWSKATGAHNNIGAIRGRYLQLGGPGGVLGYPTTDEICGLRGGGCFQGFGDDKGIWWSPTTGAHNAWGAIREKWMSIGFENGPLGWPTSDEICGLVGGGCFQTFQGGAIYWSPATGAHPVWGAIREEWGRLGWEFGKLGYPASDEVCRQVRGGCWQNFANGAVLWSPATGAHESVGLIREEYARQGFERGPLGWPTTGEQCGQPDSGCVQNYEGGRIVWSPGRAAYSLFR